MDQASDFMAGAPPVDTDRIDSIYRVLNGLGVSLDADPLELGPKRLNNKIAECRSMLSRCETVFLDVSKDLHWFKRRYRAAMTDHQLQVQNLLANDPTVRSGLSIRDREAMASMKLRDHREALDKLQSGVEDLEQVMAVIKAKRNDLKDTQGRLKDQLKVCQEEINLGGRWGFRSDRVRASVPPFSPKEIVLDDSLDALMDKTLAEGVVPRPRELAPKSEEPVAVQPTPEAPSDNAATTNKVEEDRPSPSNKEVDEALASIPDMEEEAPVSSARRPVSIAEIDLDAFLASS